MLVWLAVGVFLLVVVLGGSRWLSRQTPHDLARAMRTFGAVFAALAGTGLLFMGQLGLLLILIVATAMAMLALKGSSRPPDPVGAGSGGQQSAVTTDLLAMRLDHATGELAGEVRQGPLAGRSLASLGLPDLLRLLAGARSDDPPSVALLETWLDRHHPDWRAADRAGEPHPAAAADAMDESMALGILGLPPGADAAAVRAAHRRLMGRVHPDHGGSDWLAARINAARDFLLGRP